jgi:uncharacterized protein (UPF0261 family)
MDVRVVCIGTSDSKGKELDFLRQGIEKNQARAVVMDVSCKQAVPMERVDYPCGIVARSAGIEFSHIASLPKADAARIMARGAVRILEGLLREKRADAAVAIGGGSGTAMGCEILRALPNGVPKIMVSAVAASDLTWHLGTKDIVVFNAVVDICLNRILRQVLRNAAQAAVALAKDWHARKEIHLEGDKPLVGATMYGVTQPCVFAARERLEAKGYEVVIFSGGGKGPASMEELVGDGAIDLVMDITTTSLIDDVVGGSRSSGRGRFTAISQKGIPQVVTPGAIDMVNFGPPQTVPEKFKDRLFYYHTDTTTLMRANAAECRALALRMAGWLNGTQGPVAFLIPQKGFSKYDHAKGPRARTYEGTLSDRQWFDPRANKAFIETLRKELDTRRVQLRIIPAHINDPAFATAIVQALLRLGK